MHKQMYNWSASSCYICKTALKIDSNSLYSAILGCIHSLSWTVVLEYLAGLLDWVISFLGQVSVFTCRKKYAYFKINK